MHTLRNWWIIAKLVAVKEEGDLSWPPYSNIAKQPQTTSKSNKQTTLQSLSNKDLTTTEDT